MSKVQRQKQTNKEFVDRIDADFDRWRRKKGKANNTRNLLEYLVRHNLMRQTIINRWMTLNEYEAQIQLTKSPKNPKGVKSYAIWGVEELLPLGETQIKANIRNHSTYFRENVFKFP